jgi:hypothetical protein
MWIDVRVQPRNRRGFGRKWPDMQDLRATPLGEFFQSEFLQCG